MKNPVLKKLRRGFTLIELLTVIAIIGILAALASQAAPLAMKKARQLSASGNARDVAIAYNSYAISGVTQHTFATGITATVTAWATQLAQKADFNSGKSWFLANELQNDETMPEFVINPVTKIVDTNFSSIATSKLWAVVAGATRNASFAANYPIIFTRGIGDGPNNTWNPQGPWNGSGGHIAYLDGHVEWYTSTVDDNGNGIFFTYGNTVRTNDVTQAIGTTAAIRTDAAKSAGTP